jgi:hypothetical protein
MSSVQRLMRPRQHQAEIVPIIVATDMLGNDVMDFYWQFVVQRQTGDGTSVFLPFQEVKS